MGWVKQSEDERMPEWLKENLSGTCNCGFEKENFYNVKGECTSRRCTNPKCPEMLAQRIADMCTLLEISGIKEGKGLKLVKMYNLESHYAALPYILEDKPTMSLSTFMKISFIPGIDSMWDSYCSEFSTVDELYTKGDEKCRNAMAPYFEEIKKGAEFVKIKPAIVRTVEPLVVGNVMMTGKVKGYDVREKFIYALNTACKGYVALTVVEKRKTNVMALIKEQGEPVHGKEECALENNIPIMTPDEFKMYILDLLRKKIAENGGVK